MRDVMVRMICKLIENLNRNNRNKKALVFSLATIILVAAILSFTRVFFTTSTEVNKISADAFYGDQLRYFQDDIMEGLEKDLMNTTIYPIVRQGNVITINISQGINDNDENNEQNFLDYKNFVQDNYSSNNYQFNLTDFNSEFNITPYNARYHMNDGRVYIYTNNVSNLINITVKAFVTTFINKSIETLPDDDGNDANFIPIFMYIYNTEGALQESLTTREQNPYENNDPYKVRFNDAPLSDVTNVNIEYGTYNSVHGVLQVYVDAIAGYDISGNVSIELNYNSLGTVEMIGGVLDSNSLVGNITKKSRYVLKKE